MTSDSLFKRMQNLPSDYKVALVGFGVLALAWMVLPQITKFYAQSALKKGAEEIRKDAIKIDDSISTNSTSLISPEYGTLEQKKYYLWCVDNWCDASLRFNEARATYNRGLVQISSNPVTLDRVKTLETMVKRTKGIMEKAEKDFGPNY